MLIDSTIPATAGVDVRDQVAAAEAAGYAAVWASEVKHDPFVALTLAATASETIELGTSIALAFVRNPMSMAVQANDLQTLSRGRLLLGLGTQVKAHIERRFSMPWSHPAARMREYVSAMRAIWAAWETGDKLDFRGDYYTHTLMTPFFTPGPNPFGPPKVLLAGVGDLMTRVAGEVADGFLCHGFTTERYLREVTLPALRAARGDDLDGFDLCGMPFVATGRTEQDVSAAVDAVRAQIAFYGSTPAYRGVLELHGWDALADELLTLSRSGEWDSMGALIDDEVVSAFAVVGPPADVAAGLLARYGDVMTRMTLYTPYDLDAGLAGEVAARVRADDTGA